MCEETEWTDVALIVSNITCLFDVYFYLLSSTDPQWKELRYKAEMTVLSIIGEVSAIQLLPSLLLLWKVKNGIQPLVATVLGIDSLLNICETLKEVRHEG